MITQLHFSEAIHVVTNAHLYSDSYVTLCFKFLHQNRGDLK